MRGVVDPVRRGACAGVRDGDVFPGGILVDPECFGGDLAALLTGAAALVAALLLILIGSWRSR